MKFLQILGYATLALALPSPAPLEGDSAVEGLEKRSAIAGAVPGIITTLQNTVATNAASINQAVNQIKATNNAAVVLQLQSQLNTNYKAILAALQTAATKVTASTTGAVGGISGSLQGLTQAEATALVKSLNDAITALKGIQTSFNLTGNSGVASVKTAVSAEVKAIQKALTGLTAPLATLATGLSASSLTGAVTVTGLPEAVQSLFATVKTLLTNV